MTDSDTNLRELILARIDDLLAHDDASSFTDASERLLQSIADAHNSLITGEADFLRGYLLYLQPETKRALARVHEIRSLLLRTLSASSDKSLAGRAELYLGHIAYDVASYAEATVHFREAQRHDLSPFLQAKSSEMLVCCALRLEGAPAALPELTSFVARIEKMEAQDIWPSELARVLKEVELPKSTAVAAIMRAAANSIDRAGSFGAWFSDLVGAAYPPEGAQ